MLLLILHCQIIKFPIQISTSPNRDSCISRPARRGVPGVGPDVYPPDSQKKFKGLLQHHELQHSNHNQAVAMLPSRGITQTLRPIGSQAAFTSRLTVRNIARVHVKPHSLTTNCQSRTLPLRTGRQFGTSLKSANGILRSGAQARPRTYAGPIAVGSVASSRNLSLWGWGWSGKKPTEQATPTETTAAAEPAAVAEPVKAAVEAPASSPAAAADPSTVTATDLDLSAIDKIVNAEDILNMTKALDTCLRWVSTLAVVLLRLCNTYLNTSMPIAA